ncbi:MAG: class I tRNA ligase family protein [Pirellulales bacterium]
MDFKSLPSQYDHAAAQAKWYPEWERRGYFHAEVGAKDSAGQLKPPFTIVIPPPNVTGALHLGHALNNTLQDILIRMKRMQGFNTLWMPGTDHAGIATQAVVERRLFEEEKKTRHDLGREGLVARIWQWKEQYEARILGQLKQLGCSCDWARTQFTFNEHNSRAVREWFFKLFQDGKIYRGKRLVNWDTFLQTAVSDDEVFHETVKGAFWHFKYPVIDPKPGEPTHVTIATTRPETMLGDTAVAVHPDPSKALDRAEAELKEKLAAAPVKEREEIQKQIDAVSGRRQAILPGLVRLRDMALAGRKLHLPLANREIPLIADEWAKPELGSGCVKITPAHDANDYEVYQRHPEIGIKNIMTVDGLTNDAVPDKYRGLKMHTKAREAVVADMEAQGFYNPETDREDREIDLAHSDRSKTPIEPYLADQWFVKMDELAQTAMDAVTSGNVKITPERYAKGYLDWLGEKRDWPIGRQLWWGHRIPVWQLEVPIDKDPQPAIDAFIEVAASLKFESDISYRFDEELDAWWICARTVHALDCINAIVDEWYPPQVDTTRSPGGKFTRISRPESSRHLAGAMPLVHALRGPAVNLIPESDVLDTWFSSALWPISTLGWPDQTPELKTFYPTSTLITSRDIITLWVARMVIAGLYNQKQIPFHEVYITPKILDGYGETMSKSKGNGVDPLDVIEKFGADALRFGLAYLTTDTQDVKLPVDFECPHCGAQFPQTKKNRQLPRIECEKCKQPFRTQWAEKPEDKELARGSVVSERFELGRNFCNKLWNASRFSLINLEGYTPYIAPASGRDDTVVADKDLLIEDRWLLSRLSTVTEQVTALLEKFRYADAARTLYDFAWNEFCSFYVEMTKARFALPVGGDSVADSGSSANSASIAVGDASHKNRQTAQRVLAHALDTLLRLLHPMIPFLTEEVWQLLAQVAPDRGLSEQSEPGRPRPRESAPSVCIAPWPVPDKTRQDPTIEAQFADFQSVLGALRETRQQRNIPFTETLDFTVRCDAATAKRLEPMQPYFAQMAKATGAKFGPQAEAPAMAAPTILSGQSGPLEVYVDVSRFIDVAAERKKLDKDRETAVKFIASIDAKLANAAFVDKAPVEVVQQQRDKRAELAAQIESIDAALKQLG